MRPLTGLFPAEMVRLREVPRPPADLLRELLAIDDLTGTVSDVLDALGLDGAVPGSVLVPMVAGGRIVGPALTVATELRGSVEVPGSRMGDLECHNLAEPGDVLVVQGAPEVSSMGAISARIGRRQREAGAVVDGAVRDVGGLRRLGFPVWARGPSPRTGKYRLRTVAINGAVSIHGVTVHPGDLVVADDTGVCFVPRERAEDVLAGVRRRIAGEAARVARIDAGVPVPDLARGD